MARKKRRRAKKANPARKRTSHKRKKRANPAPARRRKRASHRRRAKNPVRRARRSHARRSVKKNPARRRSHRRHARNPGSGGKYGAYKAAGFALLAAAAGFAGVQAASYYGTPDGSDKQERNRKIIAIAALLGGLYLAKKKPLIGVGLASGALLSGFGTWMIFKLISILPAKQAIASKIGAVAYDNMQGYELGAVAYDNLAGYQLGMGAVAYDNMRGMGSMGSPVPPAPWESASPF